MKKPKIDIDVKALLIDKGEKIALGVTGSLCVLLLVIGVLSFAKCGKPEEHAKELEALVKKKELERNNEPVPDNLGKIPANLIPSDKKADRIEPTAMVCQTLPVQPRPGEDGRRRAPVIFLPEEWAIRAGFVQLHSLIFDDETKKEKIWVVEGGSDTKKDTAPQLDTRGLGGRGGFPGGGMFGGGMNRQNQYGGVHGQQAHDADKGGKLKLIPIEDLDKKTGARLAERVMPLRMAIISGSFPMRRQYQEYVDALKYPDLNKLVEDAGSLPTFEEIMVQRQAIGSDGRPEGEFVNIELKAQITDLLIHTRKEIEPDDKDLQSLMFDGLVTPRPKLMDLSKKGFSKLEYPKVEQLLPGLQRALAELKRKGESKVAEKIKPKTLLTDPSGINPFSPKGEAKSSAPAGSGSGSKSGPLTPEESAALEFEAIPEFYLFRFIDANLEAGKTYQYRIKLQVKNPNFGNPDVAVEGESESKSIYSTGNQPDGWYLIPQKVYVPQEFQVYIAEEKAAGKEPAIPQGKDQVALQIHRWLDNLFPDPNRQIEESKVTIGDWVIAERDLYYRGESIKRALKLEVPIYNTIADTYNLVVENPKAPAKDRTKVVVTIGPEEKRAEAVLVDFEGGKLEYKKDESIKGDKGDTFKATLPIEALILGPDGKLIATSNAPIPNDVNSERKLAELERKARVEAFKEKVEKIKKGSGSGSGSKIFEK